MKSTICESEDCWICKTILGTGLWESENKLGVSCPKVPAKDNPWRLEADPRPGYGQSPV